jgi:hypothetical protein
MAVENFQLPSATGNFDITTTKCQGVTPKAVLFFLCSGEVNEVAHNTNGENGFYCFGAADGTNEWSVYGATVQGTNNDGRGYSDTKCLFMGASNIAATFDSFIQNGVRISIDTLAATEYLKRGFAVFLGGVDVEVAAGIVDNPDVSKYTNVGFEPDAVFFSGCFHATPESITGTNYCHIGMALNNVDPASANTEQWCCHVHRSTGSGITAIGPLASGDPVGSGGISAQLDCDSFDAFGFTIGWRAAASYDIGYLAFKLGETKSVGMSSMYPPLATGVHSHNNLGIDPEVALFLLGGGFPDIDIADGYGVGWLDMAGDGGSMWTFAGSGIAGTTRMYGDASGSLIGEFDSFGSNSMGVDFTAVAASNRLWPFMVVGPANPGRATRYSNKGGIGDRRTSIVETSTATFQSGAVADLIDGSFGGTAIFDAGQSGRELKWDFGAGTRRIIDEAIWYQQSPSVSHGTWKMQGSNNDSDWADIGGTFDLGGLATTAQIIPTMYGNTTGYRYYRMLQTAGTTSNSIFVEEIEFRISGTSGNAIGEVVGASAAAAVGLSIPISIGASAGTSTAIGLPRIIGRSAGSSNVAAISDGAEYALKSDSVSRPLKADGSGNPMKGS